MEIDTGLIEEKWQNKWEETNVFKVSEDENKKKFYVLEMFPYPSGAGLHMGHAINFTISDIFVRFKRMQGFNVLYPMGYDSLGLPAENAAIKNNTHPEDYTRNSINNFKNQQKKLGFSYDTSRIINTADPNYYKWDQWIFLKMFEKGIAYKKKSMVNYCPSCKTVLANEQSQGGVCERCKSKVHIKNLNQWFLRITDYSDKLLEGHKKLDWPEKTIAMQKNWIGKSHGTEINFEINGEKWPIFTTRPDTIFGVTFMVISAYHEKLLDLVTDKQKKEVEIFLKKLKSVSEKELGNMEKEGVFTGSYAVNPINKKKIPVYVGNFVVADYGCGMVMAVPAHDQRDFEFAKKYDIEINQVIEGDISETRAYSKEGTLINSGDFNGIENKKAIGKITDWLIENNLGKKTTNYKLKDWGISRQRYWGTPIPIIYCDKCGEVAVPEKDLPIKLPKEVKFGKGNPLETNEDWIKTKCPKCNGAARRETDTMDTFVNSSWYFLRYCDPNNLKEIFDKKKVNYWCPLDLYIGGAEHACMHLIYARFYTMFLKDLGYISFDEFAPRLFHQGMLHASDGNKMSKSLGNTVDPIETVDKYGADSLRFALMSFASPDKDTNWNEKVMIGSNKFVNKVANSFMTLRIGKESKDMQELFNKNMVEITDYLEKLQYRKITIKIRSLFDRMLLEKDISEENLKNFLKIFSLFCPHLSEELWEKLGYEGFISISKWPTVDKTKLITSKKKVELDDKIISNLVNMIEKIELKNKKIKKIYLYLVPKDMTQINKNKISKSLGKDVLFYSTSDKEKYDPENKSKKAKLSLPGIYFE